MHTRHATTRPARHTRRGFTLVEMLVAMALSLGIMVIIAEAFQRSLDFVLVTKTNGELMNQLASAGNMLEHDLKAEHFRDINKPNGGVRLSDQWMHQTGWVTPQGGFFRIESPQPVYGPTPFAMFDREGNTLSYSANHRLHFTSIHKGTGESELFVAAVNGQPYKSRVAEVAWFLVPNGRTTAPAPDGLPLYDLVRRYRLVALDDGVKSSLEMAVRGDVPPTYPVPTHQEVISVPNPNPAPGTVNTLATVADPVNRMTPLAPLAPTKLDGTPNPRYREDVVLTDVLSFQVLVWWDGSATAANPRPYGPPGQLVGPIPANTEAPYDFLHQGGVFDTRGPATNPSAVPLPVRVRSLQITIRICNTRVGISRSITKRIEM